MTTKADVERVTNFTPKAPDPYEPDTSGFSPAVVASLQAGLQTVDMSVRGTAAERAALDAEAMNDLAHARGAANRAELGRSEP